MSPLTRRDFLRVTGPVSIASVVAPARALSENPSRAPTAEAG